MTPTPQPLFSQTTMGSDLRRELQRTKIVNDLSGPQASFRGAFMCAHKNNVVQETMFLRIMGRQLLEICPPSIVQTAVLILIRCPGSKLEIKLPAAPHTLCPVEFMDYDPARLGLDTARAQLADGQGVQCAQASDSALTPSDAELQKIVDVFNTAVVQGGRRTVIVCCEAGLSRSPAVATALAEFWSGTAGAIELSYSGMNKYVLYRLRTLLNSQLGAQDVQPVQTEQDLNGYLAALLDEVEG